MTGDTWHVICDGWREVNILCQPTSTRGRLSENLNLSMGFVIQEVKVQTLINFYESLYKEKYLNCHFSKNWTGVLANTYSYADWQSLQWLPVTPTFASPVQWHSAEGLAVSRPLSEATHNWTREQWTKYLIWIRLSLGALKLKKMVINYFLHTLFLCSSYFLEYIGQFLQLPAAISRLTPAWPDLCEL